MYLSSIRVFNSFFFCGIGLLEKLREVLSKKILLKKNASYDSISE